MLKSINLEKAAGKIESHWGLKDLGERLCFSAILKVFVIYSNLVMKAILFVFLHYIRFLAICRIGWQGV